MEGKIRINRVEFLQSIEAIQAGLAPRGIIDQSDCFVFQDGEVRTFNDDIFCRTKSPLPKEFSGAVPAKKLIAQLSKWEEPDIFLEPVGRKLYAYGHKKRSTFTMEQEIRLPTADLRLPSKGDWKPLHEDFCDAITIVYECVGKNQEEFLSTLIHLHPKWIEAGTEHQVTRYKIKTDIKEPRLIPGTSLRPVADLEVIEFAEVGGWIHFRNAHGTSIACKLCLDVGKFFDISPHLEMTDGTAIQLPKGIADACEKASVFTEDEADHNFVTVTISKGKLKIDGEGAEGRHEEFKDVRYDGPPREFIISPKMLTELVKRYSECLIGDDKIRVDGGKFIHVTSLGKPADEDTSLEEEDE